MSSQPLREMAAQAAAGVRVVLSDIDDTLTTDGRLDDAAYSALWDLHRAGLVVIPVTGRPAGWCDLIARQWPVDAVVGENGAFAMRSIAGRVETIYHPNAERDAAVRLRELERAVRAQVPEIRIAGDQPFRWFDIAFDFAEEEPDLGLDVARTVRAVCEAAGAEAKISSIHVNAWYGVYSKVEMAREVLANWIGVGEGERASACVFAGDSPNDEPMFAEFPLSVGVANLRAFLDDLRTPPAFLTPSPNGAGFAELAAHLLASR